MHRALHGYRQRVLAIDLKDLKELHQEGHQVRLSSSYSRNHVIQYMVECGISQQGVLAPFSLVQQVGAVIAVSASFILQYGERTIVVL